jgi:hypothetical protein
VPAIRLEDRVAALEAEVTRLKRLVEDSKPAGWRKLIGSFLNDPYYEEAMKYGRQYRESTRPKLSRTRKPKRGDS